jgi:outer membrane lipoprotein-sorting protein
MRGRVLGVGLIILALGATQTLTADWPSILEKTKAKYAGFEKEIKDMTMIQEIKTTAPDMKGRSPELKMLKKGEKFRMESTMQMPDMPKEMGEMKSIVIHDGKDTWVISSMTGKKKLSEEDSKQYETGSDWWKFLSEQMRIAGTEKIGTRECYVLEIEEEGECPYTKMWMDKEHLVLVKAESQDPEPTMMLFSDFRELKGGWEIPYKTEVYVDGKLLSSILVKSIEINKGLSDDLFNPDKVEVKGFNMQEMMKMMKERE